MQLIGFDDFAVWMEDAEKRVEGMKKCSLAEGCMLADDTAPKATGRALSLPKVTTQADKINKDGGPSKSESRLIETNVEQEVDGSDSKKDTTKNV